MSNKATDHPIIIDAIASFKEVALSWLYDPEDFLRDLVMQRATIRAEYLHLSAVRPGDQTMSWNKHSYLPLHTSSRYAAGW